jgi:hypothetical protein
MCSCMGQMFKRTSSVHSKLANFGSTTVKTSIQVYRDVFLMTGLRGTSVNHDYVFLHRPCVLEAESHQIYEELTNQNG